MRGYFVTGTDTGVGKTVLSAALALRTGYGYWKPVQTGPESDTDTVRCLAGCTVWERGIRLPDPVSPHLAAERAGMRVQLSDILAQAPAQGEWIIEGAGGVLVPINDREKMIDLMVPLALPVVVAARSTLGTINHTLLTLAALRARGLAVERVVLIGPPHPENCDAIEKFGNVTVTAIPWFEPLTREVLKEWTAKWGA